jgi:hypothetical protein
MINYSPNILCKLFAAQSKWAHYYSVLQLESWAFSQICAIRNNAAGRFGSHGSAASQMYSGGEYQGRD